MRVGYVRVSSVDQNTARHLDGVEVECTFTDAAFGKDTARPKLEEMIRYVRYGDVVLCTDLLDLAHELDAATRTAVEGLRGLRILLGRHRLPTRHHTSSRAAEVGAVNRTSTRTGWSLYRMLLRSAGPQLLSFAPSG